ncbi:MAG: amidohydrolase family protein [Candidatus Onthomonas sp.]
MFDYLIQGAAVLDGTGRKAFIADVAVLGGSIAAVGQLSGAQAIHRIDATGQYLTPGLIDIHRHGDSALFRPDFGRAELAQGLTTIVNGNCGLSMAPVSGPHQADVLSYLAPVVGGLPQGRTFPSIASYRQQAAEQKLPLNVGMLAGMGTLRAGIAGFRPGPLSAKELQTLHRALEQTLSEGALGVSLGLGYAPECFYDTQGLIQALAPLRRSGVPITVHMRQEGDGVVDALQEMLTVARALETPVEISHLKAIGPRNWNRAVPEMLALLTRAREDGLDVACDVYPYPAGSTQLIHVLPPEFQAGGLERLTQALQDPAERQAMRQRMESDRTFENISALVGFEHILATGLRQRQNLPFEGLSLAEISAQRNKDPYDALFDLLVEEHCGASMIDVIAHEGDIDALLRAPFSSVISDATYPDAGLLHPRVYGTCPRLLETYVAKRRVLTLPQAIHKLTGLPAGRLGLTKKGRICPGADADLCLFQLEEIHETASWQQPRQLAQGMNWVFVQGVPAIAEYAFTGISSGHML